MPRFLLTILSEDGKTSHSHALPKEFIEEQAGSLGLQPVFRCASWQQYEEVFIAALREFKQSGIEVGIFGDIDLEEHREWVRRVCGIVGIEPVHPLWKRDRRELLEEFMHLGFKARIVVVHEQKLDRSFLGKTIDEQTIREMREAGIDPSGELGEYHTVVTNGPIFSSGIEIGSTSQESHDGYGFLKVHIKR